MIEEWLATGCAAGLAVTSALGIYLTTVVLSGRARWIVRPGNDVYLVWSHDWQNQVARLLDRELTTPLRGLAMKATYSYRF